VNGREFTILPWAHSVKVPVFPLDEQSGFEARLWADLWVKPQAVMWDRLGLVVQVAAYARAFAESVLPDASAGLKTAVLRMETELGISTSGMLQNGWVIEVPAGGDARSTSQPKGGVKKQTPTGSWLEAVKVEDSA
jgi:hypothetical protein